MLLVVLPHVQARRSTVHSGDFMADENHIINLRLPASLSKKLSYASEKAGVPKSSILRSAVSAAILEKGNGHCAKESYRSMCVRMPNTMHVSVQNMANKRYLSVNAMLVQILAENFGDEICHVAEDVE